LLDRERQCLNVVLGFLAAEDKVDHFLIKTGKRKRQVEEGNREKI
jgi:hypothetical protein